MLKSLAPKVTLVETLERKSLWVLGSVGRAAVSKTVGRRFESYSARQKKSSTTERKPSLAFSLEGVPFGLVRHSVRHSSRKRGKMKCSKLRLLVQLRTL